MSGAQIDLSNLEKPRGATRERRRVGRGRGSGLGKQSGKGAKGAGQRKGVKGAPFEGGQSPLYQRMGKRGFARPFARTIAQVVNVRDLESFAAGTTVDATVLAAKRLVKSGGKVKILGDGKLTRRLVVVADAFSAGAKKAIEAAGGEARVVLNEASKAASRA